MKKVFFVLFLSASLMVNSQVSDNDVIKNIYQNALTSYVAYNHLNELCTKAPGRLVGSKESELALELLMNQLSAIQTDTCYLQNYFTDSWRCVSQAEAIVIQNGKKEKLNVVNLGLSVSTPAKGICADVVEVHSMKQLDSLGIAKIQRKIVFFNRPMDNAKLTTFQAYGGAIDQRAIGAAKAAQYGAVGVIVRSIATENDDFPHTGVSHYQKGVKEIPNLSISTNDANKLSRNILENSHTKIRIKSDTETLKSVRTANIIAEIKGSVHPENVILIGAHTDAWFNTPGAHDDGAGCMQMMDVLRIFNDLHIKPLNTIRLVLFMDEEMYQSGANEYATFAKKENKKHIACIESDGGAGLPLGFSIDAADSTVSSVRKLSEVLKEFGVFVVDKGYGGVDIEPLKEYGFPLIGLETNSQRYFEYHHSANDTFDKVSRREMQLGTASIASFVYLIDKYGL